MGVYEHSVRRNAMSTEASNLQVLLSTPCSRCPVLKVNVQISIMKESVPAVRALLNVEAHHLNTQTACVQNAKVKM